MSINCANLTSQEYIKLKEKFGEDKANYFWNKLNGEIPEDINTLVDVQFKKAQVLMPYTIVKELKKHNIDVKNLTHQQLKDMIDSDVLEGLAYRIPNQAAASNDAFEIVGILPESVGDTIIAFKEITTKTGSDFDIDKAFVMLPNFEYNPKTRRIQTIKDDSKKGLQNKRLRLSNAMLSNPKKYPQLMKPLDTDWLKTLILGNKNQEPLIKEDKQVKDLDFYTGTTQAFNKAEFDNTKTLVGPIAKNMTNHNAIKHEELTYTKTYLGLGKYKTIEEETTIVENPIIETQQKTVFEPSGENQFNYKGKSIDTEFQLTAGQESALKQLIDFSESSDKFITLQGYAGTGKTATIGYLAKYLKDKKFLYTAPTHAATAELAFATVKTGNKEFPMTIASSVRIAKNKKTGLDEAVFTKKFSDRLNYSGNILVVDELSMLSAKDLKGLQEALKTDSSIKVIFMGDPLQIPEVDVSNPEYKQISKAFSAVKQVKLTEIKRTSNDTILNVLSNLRKNPDGSIPKTENTDKLKYLNSSEFNQLLVNTFKEEPENTVLISYTNAGVAHSNQKIRESLGFTGSPKVGEVVTGYLGYSSKQVEKGNVANSIRYTISDVERKGPEYIMKFKSSKLKNLVDLEVRGVKEEAISIFLQLSTSDSFNFEDLTDKDYKKNNERISNLMERLYNAKKDALKNPKLWDNYYRIQQTVSTFFQNVNLGNTYIYNPNSKQMELYVYDLHKGIDSDLKVEKGIDYGYAITVHKSQGSTIKNVFYDTNTLPSNAGSKLLNDKEEVGTEKGSLNYVAMSRASDLLVIKADDNSLFYPAENLLKDKKEESKQEDKTTTENQNNIYNQLGNKTKSENIVIKSWGELKDTTTAITNEGIVATRIKNTEEHFGNPFSHDPFGKTLGLIKTETIKEAVEKYIDWVINGGKSNENVKFEEEQTTGYRNRTIKNASADATIAIAVDFTSAGEKLTKTSVLGQNKKYIPIDANSLVVTKERVDKIVNELNSVNAKTLNIAGNGIYTMKGKYTQQQVDDFTYELLKTILESPNLKTKIESIRSGGQTGFDEAGTKAGIKLGLPTLTLAPKNWTFRNINGQDISNEKLFKDRFSDSDLDSRARWIRKQLKSGKLKGKPILYYKELGEPSHATALDYLINKYNWNNTESQKNKYTWSRFSDNNYEVSSANDKRFSALYAKLKDGRTIEEAYQLDIKGYRSQGNDWKLGKGKPPINNITKEDQWNQYKNLWKQYLNENPDLEKDLREKANGKVLTDKFASTDISQARALAEILNETSLESQKTAVGQSIQQSNKRTITTSRKESLVSTDIDEDGNSVEETLTGYMNAIVDGVKDPYIVKGNINLFTGGVAFMLARAGVSRDWITAFMVQPILVDLVKEMNISESRISEISRDEKGETNKALDTILKLYGSQERGSEFKESLGKNNLKNEDGDIKVTFENLKDQLENPDPALQLKILKQFFEFQDVSFRLSDLMTIMSADTDGATKNDITATMRDNLFHAVINNNTFTGLEKVLGYSKKENGEIEIDDTKYIGTFHKNSVQFFKKICKEHFITSSDSFKHATYTIANYAGYSELKNKKHAEILALIEQELFASFVEESKIFSFSSMDELQLQLVGAQPQINKVNNQMYKAVQDANDILKASEGRLLNDIERTSIMKPYLAKIQALKNEKTLAQRVSEAKLKYKDNVFLQSLLVDINPYLNGKPSTIGLNSKNLNKDAKNTLYLYWEDLLNKDEKLGTDLIKYSFYTSGLSNSFGAFFEHIPTNWLVKNGLNDFMTEKLQTLNTSHTEVLHLQKQVMRHLYKDDRIVPTISDKIITEFKSSKGNVVPNQFYLTIPAFSAGSLEIGFNNEDEKEYKTYIKRSLSDETGENTKNVMYELQGYINTKDSKGENIKTLLYRVISPLGTKTRLGYVREYGNEGPSIFSENITLLPSNIRAFVDSLKKTDPKPIQILNSPIDKSFKKDDEIDENDLIFCSINI